MKIVDKDKETSSSEIPGFDVFINENFRRCHVIFLGKNQEIKVEIPCELSKEDGIKLSNIIMSIFDTD
jgi:hypothetical protein